MSRQCRIPVVVDGEVVARFWLATDAKFFANAGVEAGMFQSARVTTSDGDEWFTAPVEKKFDPKRIKMRVSFWFSNKQVVGQVTDVRRYQGETVFDVTADNGDTYDTVLARSVTIVSREVVR